MKDVFTFGFAIPFGVIFYALIVYVIVDLYVERK